MGHWLARPHDARDVASSGALDQLVIVFYSHAPLSCISSKRRTKICKHTDAWQSRRADRSGRAQCPMANAPAHCGACQRRQPMRTFLIGAAIAAAMLLDPRATHAYEGSRCAPSDIGGGVMACEARKCAGNRGSPAIGAS